MDYAMAIDALIHRSQLAGNWPGQKHVSAETFCG
jgi:hypothetical protein